MSDTTLASNDLQRQHLQQLSQQVTTLQQQLAQKQKTYAQLQHELAQIETSYGTSTQRLSQTNQQLMRERLALDNLHHKVTSNQQSIQQAQQQLATQLQSAYRLSNQPYLKFLLEQDQAAKTSRLFHYFHYLTEYQINAIHHLQQHIESMQQNEQLLQQHYQTLQQLEISQKHQQQQLAALKQNRSQLISQINQSIHNKHEQLEELYANRQQLIKTINELPSMTKETSVTAAKLQTNKNMPANQALYNTSTTLHRFMNRLINHKDFASLQGRLYWPTVGKVSAHYGELMDAGGLHWDGVLINAKLNQPVYAVADGRIVFAKWLAGYGLLIIINHGNGYMTLYGRNHSLYKNVNDEVHTGDMIATVGRSGGYQQPDLYFAIRHNAQPLNPERWCKSS